MITQEVHRLGIELANSGHALTSYEKLGISDFERLALDLRNTVETSPQLSGEQADRRNGMVMCKDKITKLAGSAIMKPVVEVLFGDNESALEAWDMYTVNHYEVGDSFKPHQDYFDKGTVVIITTLGKRKLDVYKKEAEDDVFITIDTSYQLGAGAILLLDGYSDLGHAATCIEGPSISVVGDIPHSIQV